VVTLKNESILGRVEMKESTTSGQQRNLLVAVIATTVFMLAANSHSRANRLQSQRQNRGGDGGT